MKRKMRNDTTEDLEKSGEDSKSTLSDLLSYSPFFWKVVDGEIYRFKKGTGEEFGKVGLADPDGLCKLISHLDEDLWRSRRDNSQLRKKHSRMLKEVARAIGR